MLTSWHTGCRFVIMLTRTAKTYVYVTLPPNYRLRRSGQNIKFVPIFFPVDIAIDVLDIQRLTENLVWMGRVCGEHFG